MNAGLISNNIGGITNGNAALTSAKSNAENSKFMDLLKSMRNDGEKKLSGVSSSQIIQNGRLNGDYATGFAGTYVSKNDKTSAPVGAAANQANARIQKKTIDRTSELYEKSMELENYFVKQMISQMRKTVMKNTESDFARQTYEDMLFDEYSALTTKNAGFGIADQIYLSLV